jgi:hypothetical protein
MKFTIWELEADSAGNLGYILLDSQEFEDVAAAKSYLQSLKDADPADSFIAECVTDLGVEVVRID